MKKDKDAANGRGGDPKRFAPSSTDTPSMARAKKNAKYAAEQREARKLENKRLEAPNEQEQKLVSEARDQSTGTNRIKDFGEYKDTDAKDEEYAAAKANSLGRVTDASFESAQRNQKNEALEFTPDSAAEQVQDNSANDKNESSLENDNLIVIVIIVFIFLILLIAFILKKKNPDVADL